MAILDHPNLIKTWTEKTAKEVSSARKLPLRKRLLMVHPQYFKIAYAINPHMKGPDGKLHTIDNKKAHSQWKTLLRAFESCGLEVDVLDAQEKFPDMVFAANQSFPFWNLQKDRAEVIVANMTHEERKGEVPYFESYFNTHEYAIHKVPKEISFEGTGDAILDGERNLIFCGFGFRTDKSMPARLCEQTGYSVVPLELKNPDFYHLDTCLAPLSANSVVVVEEAFSSEGMELLRAAFENVILADKNEAKTNLTANLFCPNGDDVFIDEGNKKLIATLKSENYRVHAVDTSEFLKAGGSVFCLKLFLW